MRANLAVRIAGTVLVVALLLPAVAGHVDAGATHQDGVHRRQEAVL